MRSLGVIADGARRRDADLDGGDWVQLPHRRAPTSRRASGYRNRERFRHAIYFHLGRLDLYPECLSIAHSIP